ncbi:hypothetical protein BYT27DRAFT_7148907 [Phlegmacium glaucopus]|nr:hypothetical protein BYT27DRAFT_7148907 [Phlegmacium glaucopus]
MIIDSDHNDSVMEQAPKTPQDSPPSYDYATESSSSQGNVGKPKPDSSHDQPLLIPHHLPESYTTQPLPTPSPMVYNYLNPVSGERVISLLPPNHPEMVCLQSGSHVPHTQYGLLGLLLAVFWFPLGIGLCLLDRRVRCSRCGLVIEDGICN